MRSPLYYPGQHRCHPPPHTHTPCDTKNYLTILRHFHPIPQIFLNQMGKLHWTVKQIQGKQLLLRDRSLICIPGGRRWFWRGGTMLKQAPFWGVNFSLVRNMRGSNFMTQQQQSREFDVSDLSSIPWLGKRKELNIWRDFRSRGKGCLTWPRKSLEPSSQSAILKITQKAL